MTLKPPASPNSLLVTLGELSRGSATLIGGTVVVNTTAVTANSKIFLTGQNSSGAAGELTVSARTPGASFTILSSSGTDTRLIGWLIVEPV